MFRTFAICLLASSVIVNALPIASRAGVGCAPKDKAGSALAVVNVDGDLTCEYASAGACVYFASDGNFSSGSSTCPPGLVAGGATTSPSSSNSGSSSSNSGSSSSSSSSSPGCAASDKSGSTLTSASLSEDNLVCEYGSAGTCEYFADIGNFSSGGSTCPPGLVSGGTRSLSPQSSSSTPPPPPPTTTKPPPPPPTTTQPPPPPQTTTTPPPPPPTTTPPPPPTTTSTTTTQDAPQTTSEAAAAPITTSTSAAPISATNTGGLPISGSPVVAGGEPEPTFVTSIPAAEITRPGFVATAAAGAAGAVTTGKGTSDATSPLNSGAVPAGKGGVVRGLVVAVVFSLGLVLV